MQYKFEKSNNFGEIVLNREEQEKVKDLIEKWFEEISNIKDISNQPPNGARLDNGNSGEYARISKKYKKLIEERLGHKVWKY